MAASITCNALSPIVFLSYSRKNGNIGHCAPPGHLFVAFGRRAALLVGVSKKKRGTNGSKFMASIGVASGVFIGIVTADVNNQCLNYCSAHPGRNQAVASEKSRALRNIAAMLLRMP